MDASLKSHKLDREYVASVREVEKGGRISFLTSIMGQGIRVCFHIMMGRALGAHGYGLFTLGFSILEAARLFSLIGFQNSVVHFLAIFRGEGDRVRVRGTLLYSATIVAFTSSLVAVCLWFFGGWIADRLFEEPGLRAVINGFALALPFYVLLAFFAHCSRGFRNMKYYNGALDVMHPLGNLVLIGGAFLLGMHLEGAIWAFVISTVISMLLMIPVIFRLFPQLLNVGEGCRFEARRILSYGIKVAPVDLSRPFLHDQKDNMLLGYFGVARDVGIYGAGSMMGMKIGFFQHMFNGIFAPMIADLHNRGKHREVAQLFKTVSKWTLLLTLPLFFAFIFAGPALLALFGREFGEGWTVLVILGLCKLINIATGPVGFMLLMTGHPTVELANNGLLGLGNLLLNIWLIPRYGAVGAALGTGASMVLINVIRLLQVYRLLGCHPFRFGTVKTLGAFLLAGGLLWQLRSWFPFDGWWSIAAVIPFTILYGALLTIFGWDDEDQLVMARLRGRLHQAFRSSVVTNS
jgi:O-antigen/teichoic acid export membrane protein